MPSMTKGYQTHIMSVSRSSEQNLLHPKKVGTLPVEGDEELKRTNEIKMAIPLLDAIDIQGKDITADALLTQRKLADYLVRSVRPITTSPSKATSHDSFKISNSISRTARNPDFIAYDPPDHGRIETRKIWTTTALNVYLNFPARRTGLL